MFSNHDAFFLLDFSGVVSPLLQHHQSSASPSWESHLNSRPALGKATTLQNHCVPRTLFVTYSTKDGRDYYHSSSTLKRGWPESHFSDDETEIINLDDEIWSHKPNNWWSQAAIQAQVFLIPRWILVPHILAASPYISLSSHSAVPELSWYFCVYKWMPLFLLIINLCFIFLLNSFSGWTASLTNYNIFVCSLTFLFQ